MSEIESETPFVAPEPSEIAPLFPEYEIQYLIACGGMGAVYHAIQTALQREVAVKLLPQEFSDDVEFCEGFATEAKAMARLNHPNLIGVYDFGETGGMLYIVMEYVSGQSLFEALSGQALDPDEAMRLISSIAEGLGHAHEFGILHRDIKPANILLDAEAQPKIGDFGLASETGKKVQEGEAIFGTPHYTAPEIIQPPHRFDQKADVFSLGVMLHELLTGSLPADDPRPPSAISGCDSRLDAVVKKATNVNPMLRYNSAMEIADALRNISSTDAPRSLQTNILTRGGSAPRVVGGGAGGWSPRPAAPMMSQQQSSGGVLWFLFAAVIGLVILFLLKPDIVQTLLSGGAIIEIEQQGPELPQGQQSPQVPKEEVKTPNKVFDMVLPE